MGLKPLQNTIVVEALEVQYYIHYSIVAVPPRRPKRARSLLKLFARSSSQQSKMVSLRVIGIRNIELSADQPNGNKWIEIMANKKGNGRNTRYQNVQMREDASVDRHLVSEKVANALLADGKPESITPESVQLNDGKSYRCTAKFNARWCRKGDPLSEPITLYVTHG